MIGDPVIPHICLRQYETLTPLIAQEKRNIYKEKSAPNQAPNSQINNVNLLLLSDCHFRVSESSFFLQPLNKILLLLLGS
jgi:hypothetical protein